MTDTQTPAPILAAAMTPEQLASMLIYGVPTKALDMDDVHHGPLVRALRTARNEALQEAAAIARDYDEDHANRAVMRNTAAGIFERICALKS
jgi:hypothetical protein